MDNTQGQNTFKYIGGFYTGTPSVSLGGMILTNYPQGTWVTSTSPFNDSYKTKQRRQLKLFVYLVKEFVKRYPSWELVPDAAHPFDSINIQNTYKALHIINKFPMNEIEVKGLNDSDYASIILEPTFPGQQHLLSFPDLQMWALGIEPLPKILQ